MKPSEAIEILMFLNAAFPASKLDETSAKVFRESIVDLPAEAARAAAQRLAKTRTFMPSIAEIRGASADVALGPRRSGAEAYDVLMQAVARFGWPSPPRFRDRHIQRAIGVWGTWGDLCSSPSDDPGGRARFIELYEQLAGRERADVVSGAALPEPGGGQGEFLPRERPEAPKALPKASTGLVAPKPPPPPDNPANRRKWTAAELDEELTRGRARPDG